MRIADWAPIIIALISLSSAWLAGRSARSAAKYNTDASITNERVKAETDSYVRARDMYVTTIQHQDAELKDLRDELRELKADNRRLNQENTELRRRVSLLEQQGGFNG